MVRKFHIRSYNNTHTVYEVVRGGERAVSPCYHSKAEAEQALITLRTINVPRVKAGAGS
jgi:hypothetical protein